MDILKLSILSNKKEDTLFFFNILKKNSYVKAFQMNLTRTSHALENIPL